MNESALSWILTVDKGSTGFIWDQKVSGVVVLTCTMIIFELVLLGDFNRNKNNLEENQEFVKLSAKPQLGRNEFVALFSPLASYVESIHLKKSTTVFLKFLSLQRS